MRLPGKIKKRDEQCSQGEPPTRLLKKDVSPRDRAGHAQDKDAKSGNSSAIDATENAVLCRPVRSRGRDLVFQQPATPGQSLGHRSLTIWGTVTVLAVTAVVMLLLGAEPLHRNADLMEPSPFRSAALVVTGGLLRASNVLHADWPWQQVALGEKSPVTTGVPMTPVAVVTTETGPTSTVGPPTTQGSTTASSSTTTTTLPPTTTTTLPVFTKAQPLRILVVGDSLMNPVGFALMRQATTYPALDVKAITKASSGLVRPDFYNWPQVLTDAVAGFHPHVTVMLFGGNEKQAMRFGDQSLDPFSDAWNAEYAKRVDEAIEISTTSGASVIWVGMPIMRSSKFSETARTLNAFYKEACAKHPNALYIDGYALFSDPNGAYSAYLQNSAGENQLMRSGDGIHFTDRGGDRIAEAVIQALLTTYRLEP